MISFSGWDDLSSPFFGAEPLLEKFGLKRLAEVVANDWDSGAEGLKSNLLSPHLLAAYAIRLSVCDRWFFLVVDDVV